MMVRIIRYTPNTKNIGERMAQDEGFAQVQERYAEAVAHIAANYGVNPLLGRLYGLLVLAPESLSLDELAAAVGAAKSTVSVAMRTLETYRAVQRHWRKGDRRDFYAARTDFSAILQDWYRLFFRPELDGMQQANALARRALAARSAGSDWPDSDGREQLLARLGQMDAMNDLCRAWLDQLLAAAESTAPRPAEVIAIEVVE